MLLLSCILLRPHQGLLSHATFSLRVSATNTISCRVELTDTIAVSVAHSLGTEPLARTAYRTVYHFTHFVASLLIYACCSYCCLHTQALYIDGFDRPPAKTSFAPRTQIFYPCFNYKLVFSLYSFIYKKICFDPLFSFLGGTLKKNAQDVIFNNATLHFIPFSD